MQMENKKRMPQQAPQAKADKAPAEQDTALVWGKNPVTELLKSEAGVDTLLLADSMEPRMAGYYTALGKAAGAVIKRVPAGKLQKLCGTQDHQGVAAWAARIQYVGVEELLQIAKDRGEPPFLVLCDGIEDPHNLGACLRSADAAGALASGFNFGPESSGAVPVGELAAGIVRHWGQGQLNISGDPHKLHEAGTLKLDISKARVRLGWRPRWDFDKTLHHTVDWYRRVLCHDESARQVCLAQIADYQTLAQP